MAENDSITEEIKSIKILVDEFSEILNGINVNIQKGKISEEEYRLEVFKLTDLGRDIYSETNLLEAKIKTINVSGTKFAPQIAAVAEMLKKHIVLQDELCNAPTNVGVITDAKELKSKYNKLSIEVLNKNIIVTKHNTFSKDETIAYLSIVYTATGKVFLGRGGKELPYDKYKEWGVLAYSKKGYELLRIAMNYASKEILKKEPLYMSFEELQQFLENEDKGAEIYQDPLKHFEREDRVF